MLRAATLLTLVLAVGWPYRLTAEDGFIDREAKIKAAYLYQFIRYVEWPSDAFTDARSPLVIGVVGDGPVNDHLRSITVKRSAVARALVYQPVSNADEARVCHMLFFTDRADEKISQAIVDNSQQMPVLLVGEVSSFVNQGGIIAFVIVDNKIRLLLSMKNASNHRLKVSSQLAKLAEVVD